MATSDAGPSPAVIPETEQRWERADEEPFPQSSPARHQYVVTAERHPDLPATEYCGYPTAQGPCGKDIRNLVHQ